MSSFLLRKKSPLPDMPADGVLMVPPTPFFRFKSKKDMKARMAFKRKLSGSVVDGDWYLWSELRDGRRDRTTRTAYLTARIYHQKPLGEAGAYAYFMDIVRTRPGLDGLHSEADVHRRIEGLEQVIRYAEEHNTLALTQDLADSPQALDDIWVHVGGDGRLIMFVGGGHRLTIAQIMELPAIPVRLGFVHQQTVDSGKWEAILAASDQLSRLGTLGQRHHTDVG